MARPIKLNDEIQNKIVLLLMAGNYVETAASVAGVSKTTLYDWLKKGARSKINCKYKKFSNAVQKAQGEAEARLVNTINKATKADWKAAAWKLERKFPHKWGRKDRHDINHSGSIGVQIIDDIPDGEEE